MGIWNDAGGVPQSQMTQKAMSYTRRVFMGDEVDPSTLVPLGITVFLLAMLLLAILRPPMVKTTPKTEYHRPHISGTAICIWSGLVAIMACFLRWRC